MEMKDSRNVNRVRKNLENIITVSKEKNEEQPYFRGMFLHLAEKLPKNCNIRTKDL